MDRIETRVFTKYIGSLLASLLLLWSHLVLQLVIRLVETGRKDLRTTPALSSAHSVSAYRDVQHKDHASNIENMSLTLFIPVCIGGWSEGNNIGNVDGAILSEQNLNNTLIKSWNGIILGCFCESITPDRTLLFFSEAGTESYFFGEHNSCTGSLNISTISMKNKMVIANKPPTNT